jgi:hypothetical protein
LPNAAVKKISYHRTGFPPDSLDFLPAILIFETDPDDIENVLQDFQEL